MWDADAKAAKELLQQRSEIYNELANPKVDPYFGELRSAAECDEGSIPAPRAIKGPEGEGRLYHFYSGNAGALKVCDPKQGGKTQVLFLFCEREKKLYEYRQHYDFKAKWKEAPVVTCRK